MAIQVTSNQELSSLILNKVDSKETFASMLANNQVNADELYLILSELNESNEVFNIVFTLSPNLDNNVNPWSVTADKTYIEVSNAVQDGCAINAIINYSGLLMQTLYIVTSNTTISFITGVYDILNTQEYLEIEYTSNNNLTLSFHPIAFSNATLTIGSYTYDGSQNVTIPIYDGTYTWG